MKELHRNTNQPNQPITPYWRDADHSVLHVANEAHQVVDDDKKFAVSLDVSQFKPEELKVNLDGRMLTVEGKQECKGENSFMSRAFVRSWTLPEDETEYECDCSQCWNTVAATESLDWITVSLMECPLRFNDTTIRKRIANWINEECNASFSCGLRSQLDENHIVIGHFECEIDRNELRLVALLNHTIGLHQSECLAALSSDLKRSYIPHNGWYSIKDLC
ncbi:hypothetical protein GCK32_006754 [Trichostrongylus colubriformis]|uniref:SHSP domain-containing protein n=1 Tax=Trichostrongylus colubriformis TaxID=6319 RepID=A0AAN8FLN0_TRICO